MPAFVPAKLICDAPFKAVPPPITTAPMGAPETHPGRFTGVAPVKKKLARE